LPKNITIYKLFKMQNTGGAKQPNFGGHGAHLSNSAPNNGGMYAPNNSGGFDHSLGH
jgi:hypothetical protein